MKQLPRVKMQDDALLGNPGHGIFIEILIFLLVLMAASFAQSIIIAVCGIVAVATDPELLSEFTGLAESLTDSSDFPAYMSGMTDFSAKVTEKIMIPTLFSTSAIIAAVLVYCLAIEKRPARSLGLRKSGAVTEYLAGIPIGLVMYAVSVGICMINGSVTVKAVSYGSLYLIPVFFAGYMIQGMSEELLCRGYFMMSAQRRTHIVPCIIISSVIFSSLHLSNAGVSMLALINIVLFGIFEGILIIKRGSIWMAASVHTVWNFAQGNIFGVSVSGTAKTASLLTTEFAEGSAAAFWNGGAFGSEGGFAVTIVIAVAVASALFLPSNSRELSEIQPAAPDSNF